jgi:hypothetical protein
VTALTLTTEEDVSDRMEVGPLPDGWSSTEATGQFLAIGLGAGVALRASVRVFEPLATNPDYLLDRFGAQIRGPLGRPVVQSLPDTHADGISVVAFEEESDGAITARIDLVRRAWNRDIAVSARTPRIEFVDELFSAMLDLLATVHPLGAER